MTQPILATPILYGKDVECFLKDLEETDKLLQGQVYRKKQLEYLEYCEKLYLKFENRINAPIG